MKDLCSATFRCSEDLLTVGWKLGHVDVSAMPFEAPQANCTCGVENPHRTIIISSEDLSAIPCYPTWLRKAMRRCPPAVSAWESSGENTAWYTALAWPVNSCWHSPEATSKMLSVICKSCDHLLQQRRSGLGRCVRCVPWRPSNSPFRFHKRAVTSCDAVSTWSPFGEKHALCRPCTYMTPELLKGIAIRAPEPRSAVRWCCQHLSNRTEAGRNHWPIVGEHPLTRACLQVPQPGTPIATTRTPSLETQSTGPSWPSKVRGLPVPRRGRTRRGVFSWVASHAVSTTLPPVWIRPPGATRHVPTTLPSAPRSVQWQTPYSLRLNQNGYGCTHIKSYKSTMSTGVVTDYGWLWEFASQ